MPLDAICISELAKELSGVLPGARVDRVLQPEKDEVVLQMRGTQGSFRLLLSCSQSHPRVHITTTQKENPPSPPMFCMLLRKHLAGARVLSVTVPRLERVINIAFQTIDELGELSNKTLTVEMMGRHSNIILTGPDGRIIDCIKKVDHEMSEQRQVLPGLFYRQPPEQGKSGFIDVSPETFRELLKAAPADATLDRWLVDSFAAISPLIAREVGFRSVGDTEARIYAVRENGTDAVVREFSSLCSDILKGTLAPYMLIRDGTPFDFSFIPIRQYGGLMQTKKYDSYCALLDDFYALRDNAERMRQRAHSMVKTISTIRDRAARKVELQKKELSEAADSDRLREIGDIITANIHLLQKGMDSVSLVDFFSEDGKEVTIKLDPRLNPQQNAARYYKNYTKAKNAVVYLTEQIKKNEQEIMYLDSVLEEISRAASPSDLNEIRRELSEEGYISSQKVTASKTKPIAPKTYRSSTGMTIYVGVNNKQNDLLTTKLASKRDVWLHTQKIHGAHIIIDCSTNPPDDVTLEEAAILAAYHSKARNSANVPVDYTEARNVKKPSGAKPGMVIYDHYKTIFVTPDEGRIKAIEGLR